MLEGYARRVNEVMGAEGVSQELPICLAKTSLALRAGVVEPAPDEGRLLRCPIEKEALLE
jgi:hypothetical protein